MIKKVILFGLLLFFIGCENSGGNKVPLAHIAVDKTVIEAEDILSLSASQSSDSDGRIVSYQWLDNEKNLLSDRQSFSWNVPSTPDQYTLTLIITDDKGAIAKQSIMIEVIEKSNIIPTAVINVSSTDVMLGESIQLDGRSSFDVDGDIVSYQWLDGDHQVLSRRGLFRWMPSSEGVYTLTLRVVDNEGAVSNVTKRFSVEALQSDDIVMILDPKVPNSTIILHDPDPAGAYYNYVHDAFVEAEQTVVEMHSRGIANSFHFVGYDANERYQWNEFPRYVGKNIVSWDGKFSNKFIVYVVLKYKLNGVDVQKDLVYGPSPTGYPNYTENFLYISLGASAKDGTWHHYRRDIVADLHQFYPKAILEQVNGLAIRGSGRVTNIKLSSR